MPCEPGVRVAEGIDSSPDDSSLRKGAATWIEEHGDCLYRCALARVRQPEVAEDLLQEIFLAAVRAFSNFGGRSAVRSSLCRILKHKIMDQYRKAGRETSFTDLEFLSNEFSKKFVPQGFWRHEVGPLDWQLDAAEVMQATEFWETMQRCLSKLPDQIAKVFSMREMEDIPSKEVCALPSISESNLWVMLRRARMPFRGCLEKNWFVPGKSGKL